MPSIAKFEIFAVDLPFRKVFRHAAAERRSSYSLFVKCATDNGHIGYGECLPREYVTGESRDAAFELLRDLFLPRLLGMEFASLEEVKAFLGECDRHHPILQARDPAHTGHRRGQDQPVWAASPSNHTEA
jgi:muconate cycloisomerase